MTDDAQVNKEYVAGLYGRVAATYGRIGPDLFAPFGRFLVARLGSACRLGEMNAGCGIHTSSLPIMRDITSRLSGCHASWTQRKSPACCEK